MTRRGKIFNGVARVLGNISRVLDAFSSVLGVLAVKLDFEDFEDFIIVSATFS